MPCIFNVMDLELSVSQAKSLLATDHPPLLLDVREPWEYNTAHIEGSTLIPMNEIPGRAHQELDEEAPILVLCHHGARSLSVANWLRQQGFDKAQSISGGIDAWSATIDPTIPRY
jgi:rhodanese-related sulfurtransferase